MASDNCRVCGGVIEQGAASCPHCGARLGGGMSRVWVLTFFVLGVVIGLLLLVLQGGRLPAWIDVQWPFTPTEVVAPQKGPARVIHVPRQDSGSVVPRPAPATDKVIVAPMQCNREAAQGVRDKASELAELSVQGGVLQLRLGSVWEFYSPGHRRSFVEAFAEADRCLQGAGRPIRFSFRGAEVASVSAEGAVAMH